MDGLNDMEPICRIGKLENVGVGLGPFGREAP